MEETISLQEIFGVIKKRIALIFTMMFIGLGVSAIMTFVIMTPKYSSSSQLMVRLPQATEGVNSNVNDVNFNLYMITTYKDFITQSNIVSEMAHEILVKEYGFQGSAQDIKGMIQVVQEQNSQMFSIKAISTDPKIAQAVANTVAKVFQEQAKEVIEVDKITIIADADLNVKPISPNNKLNLLIGLVLGIMVGVAIAFLVELLDKTIKDDKFVKETLGFSVLGTVPQMTAKELNAKVIQQNIPTASAKAPEAMTQSRRDRARL